ncbi:Oidioi.mRNA.OKI2018_I69.chr2.g4613.t1.cds [Oikopleura dioica]|uniref:Oidioi.mRNA.OKI2018_I69.chr2.g4613.t1.cds n=1 Tax=Oikopleura dioica TaxID=34765 RepID=A0ABN7T1P8_OIKDI|nr:Oidioi.mRNA.OKI2018_I69.chr2.g4613.t1.cds [Oikopleura dioica]
MKSSEIATAVHGRGGKGGKCGKGDKDDRGGKGDKDGKDDHGQTKSKKYSYEDIPIAHKESPCFDDGGHNCHEYEHCVPEGQHLYKCCRNYFQCRQGNPHPCLGKHACNDGEFCQRTVKANEESNDFNCIKKDDKCIGMAMCTKHYFGSCSANNKDPPKRTVVQSVDDCFNKCKNNKNCKGFDLDSKGGCLLAFQSCTEDELIDHPIYDEDDMDFGNDPRKERWYELHMQWQMYENLQYTYYPMEGCKTPERSPECDETLADKVDEHMGTIMQSINSMMPYFETLNEELSNNSDGDKHFRMIVRDIIVAFGTLSGILLLAILAVKLNKTCQEKDNTVGNIPMPESQQSNTQVNNQTTVGGAVINILPRLREEHPYNEFTDDDPAPDYNTTLSVEPIASIPEELEKSPEGPKENILP